MNIQRDTPGKCLNGNKLVQTPEANLFRFPLLLLCFACPGMVASCPKVGTIQPGDLEICIACLATRFVVFFLLAERHYFTI